MAGGYDKPEYMGGVPQLPTVNSGNLNFGPAPPSELNAFGNEGNYFDGNSSFLGTPQTFSEMGTTMPEGVGAVAGNAAGGAGGDSLWGKIGNGDFGSMQGWGQLAGGLGDIGQAYMAYKNYGLAKDQFAFNKDITNRNLSNQSITVNAKLEAWAKARGMSVPKTDGSAIG